MESIDNDVDILRIFCTPIIKFKFKNHSNYNFKDIEKSVNIPNDWCIPLNTSFPNIKDDDTFIDVETKKKLKEDLKNSIDEVFLKLKLPINYTIHEFWYNIYHENQGQERHSHIKNFVTTKSNYWSGIYYNKNSTPTVFLREDKMYKTNQFPNFEVSKLKDCYFDNFYPYVEDGDIIIFPPYLEHYVPLSVSNNMRVTFSFNLLLD